MKARALAVMSDIVPQEPVSDMPVEVTYQEVHADWGALFGDGRVAALVALKLAPDQAKEQPEEAELCLLRWEQGWKFQQWVGRISPDNDWALKRGAPRQAWYVVSRRSSYPAGEHLSWWCDAKTHTLLPTGWPKNAVPSISADTITFSRQDKPGYSPTIRDIYRFTDQIGARVATCTDEPELHRIGTQLTVWEVGSDKAVTWQARQLGYAFPARYALCRQDGALPAEPFREDAVATFDGGSDSIIRGPTQFLWWRLTGLGANALNGVWDQDGKEETALPRNVTVSGIPEAVRRFTWPAPETP